MNDLRLRLENAVANLEAQRSVLGDDVVEMALAPLRAGLGTMSQGADSPQLRQVTVLFADIVGSTTLSQHLDPEEINTVLDGALARFSIAVRQHQGKVLQYAGDSLLAVFGASVAHEDDAERALRAGLAILASGRAQSAEVKDRHGHDGFDVRVGIHTGKVLLGGGVDGDNSIRGIAVNIAARLEQTAPTGTIRISQDTYRQVRGRFELLAQPPLQVKGHDEALLSYLVSGELAAPDRVTERGVDDLRTRMVGRDAPFGALKDSLAAVTATEPGALQGVLVFGEAGIGKSRLVDEFRRWTDAQPRQACWLQAHASEQHMGRPYHLLGRLLGNRAALLDSDPSPLAGDKWLDFAAPLLRSRADAAVLGHLLGLDFSGDAELRALLGEARQLRDRAFFHASQLLRALAARHAPLVAYFDDLHWADDGTLDFIEYLVRRHADLPLLLIALARPSLNERRPGWRLNTTGPRRIELQALDSVAAGMLADALLARLGQVPGELRELVLGQADGNPFYMEELVNMLIDQGVIVADADTWRHQPERLRGLVLPTTLVGVLQSRLDALPGAERRTAQLASVVGFRFWDASLLALGVPLPAGLQGLIDRELAQPCEPSSLAGLHEFRFKHHVLHQVTYDSVLKRIRRGIHAQVAHWLIGLPGATPPDLIAEHCERGGEAMLALEHWQRAAEAAASRYANGQALAHAERALALVAAEDLPRRYSLALLRCKVLDVMSERDPLTAELDALALLANQLDDDDKRCEALRRQARNAYDQGHAATALGLAKQALSLAPPTAPERATQAHALVAQCLLRLGRHDEAEAESKQALSLARDTGDQFNEALILNGLGMLAVERGDHDAAIGLYEQALTKHRELGHRLNEGGTLSNLGYAALMLGDYDAAAAKFDTARDLFARIGHRQNEAITLINLGIARLNRGLPADALSLGRQALSMLHASRDRWAQGAALRLLGQAALSLAELDTADGHFEAARTLFESLQLPQLAIEAVAGLAAVALARGDIAAALAYAEKVLASLAVGLSLDGAEEPMRIHLVCYQALIAASDPRARQVLDSACQTLDKCARRISDPKLRNAFLQQVPYHRDLLAARRSGSSGAD